MPHAIQSSNLAVPAALAARQVLLRCPCILQERATLPQEGSSRPAKGPHGISRARMLTGRFPKEAHKRTLPDKEDELSEPCLAQGTLPGRFLWLTLISQEKTRHEAFVKLAMASWQAVSLASAEL